ncbi:MAG TPA: 2-hydroxyacyl-CoA dehydratase [Candidatus Gallacutalibacter stercoravium]|nr:2-hydroxyacyl-CoA dehydratase [Candidatus Gallacutalibacter stercoravium]
MKIGLDVGSTTIKYVVLDDQNQIIHKAYERHYSQIIQKIAEILRRLKDELPQGEEMQLAISGSAGMGVAENCKLPFVQEVYATRVAANRLLPGSDVIVELGGEDAKILFLTGGMEVRMNGSCAGGTGAFIDQMATLLDITPDEMNQLAQEHEKIYTIASRCGVFAKSDIQPLLNQGARKSDISASIFYAVVNQTIAGLAQGRDITGKVVYLGGPLTFLSQLRKSFDETLKVEGICPENSLYYVALGAAFCADTPVNLEQALHAVENYKASGNFAFNPPLFASREDYDAFVARHNACRAPRGDMASYTGGVYLGMDAGSTTVKAVVVGEQGQLLLSEYLPNSGNPVPLIKEFLEKLYAQYPEVHVLSSAVTGYGEEIIQNAFCVDYGIVETVAHLTAAKRFMPDVQFVIDIGGQDIKCFQIHNGAIDNIYLNEACSSGCGSFLQTFANALGYSIEEFAQLGLFAKQPVNLGSRCTVFMNSSVKQAQKDGATIEDISAGLSLSVVKNALYKVIRAGSPGELGERIVVQGGTFLNDAVLRAFEQEMGVEVVRPDISGLMGAYGAALYAQQQSQLEGKKESGIVTPEKLAHFVHKISVVSCGLCSNHCRLTVNTFEGGRKYIGGNRCEKPITRKKGGPSLNIYEYKQSLLEEYRTADGPRGVIGLPLGLNFYELLPFWHAFFTSLGFGVRTSPFSTRKLYLQGQHTIPSDTVCFPAKLMHGHVQSLIDEGVDTIFYPCMSYNLDEHLGDNHYNCPVVAYYPEVIAANMGDIHKVRFIKDYVGLHRPHDFPIKMHGVLSQYFDGITLKEVKKAAKAAYAAYADYFEKVRRRGQEIVRQARQEGRQIIVLAGRPYHVDPEINHGIDKLIGSFGVAVVSEDVVSAKEKRAVIHVLNQWTYHSRLYAAARYVRTQPDMNLVQLVSFGCGVDAITTDEVRDILEQGGKIYTQIKIDEITNLGAVKIRLRSLLAAIAEQKATQEKKGEALLG